MVDLSRIKLKPGHEGVVCRGAFGERFRQAPTG
jgi:hypothetical protein